MPAASPKRRIVRTARDAALLCEPHLEDAEGRIVVLHLAADRTLLHLGVQRGDGPLRAIVADAIRHRSAGLVIAHSHAGADPDPREDDIAMTRRLFDMGAALGITLHDHLIFGGGECRSFRALGLL